MSLIWHLNLLGPLVAQRQQQQITRFRTHKTAALLGYLAHTMRPHGRESLISLLWPEANLENGRNSLSVALSSLRTQLEPVGVEFGSVLVADRTLISLAPGSVITDVNRFQELLSAAETLDGGPRLIATLQSAVDLHRGRFLEGLYEDWIVEEGRRLENLFLGTLDRLLEALEAAGDFAAMRRYAEQGVAIAPWREASHRNLMRAMLAQGQHESALRHYRQWLRQEQAEGNSPSPAMRRLAQLAETTRGRPESDVTLRTAPHNDSTPEALTPVESRAGSAEPVGAAPSGAESLPRYRTRFFGRRPLLSRLLAQLTPKPRIDEAGPRLLTLTGMGGSGKTRLASEAAHHMLESYAQRVWFVPLTSLYDPAHMDVVVRDSLGIQPEPATSALDQVVAFLASDFALLVLDNFETLLPLGAAMVVMLLARLPELRCLVTSRERLGVEGETELHVRPLPVPRPEQVNLDVGQALRYPGVRLFVDRAASARPDFGLTRRNTMAVTQLCRTLEGVPLALELAAARASALSPAQMVEQLEHGTELLKSTRRDLPERHRSMQAAIDASYRLLPLELRRFFRQQSVFRGGWTPAAAEVVCEEPRALHFAAQLRGCSLLYQQERAEEVRFSSLETLREFGAALLEPAERAWLQERHARYFLDRARIASPLDPILSDETHLARFRADLNNFRGALEWAASNDSLLCLQLATALWPWWEAIGYLAEGRSLIEQALDAAPAAPKPLRAEAYFGAGKLVYNQDFAISRGLLEAAVVLYREIGDLRGLAMSLCPLSTLLMNLSDPAAIGTATEALNIARQIGDEGLEIEAAFSLGVMMLGAGDTAEAHSMLEQCIGYFRTRSDTARLAQAVDVMGIILWASKDYDRATEVFDESITLARQLNHGWLMAHSLWGVSATARQRGDLALALQAARESVLHTREGQFQWFLPFVLANLGHAQLEAGLTEYAVPLLAASEAHQEKLGTPLVPIFVEIYQHYKTLARDRLSAERFEELWAQGREFSFEEALEFGLNAPTHINS